MAEGKKGATVISVMLKIRIPDQRSLSRLAEQQKEFNVPLGLWIDDDDDDDGFNEPPSTNREPFV